MIDDIPHRLGSQLRTARLHRGWTQRGVGARCGISQPAWSRMELGHGGRTTLDDWAMAAGALDLGIAAELVGAPRPDADGRLWQLVERLTEAGGWSTHTDDSGSIRMARTSRREAAVAAIWDVIADVDAATADLLEAIGRERSRRPPD